MFPDVSTLNTAKALPADMTSPEPPLYDPAEIYGIVPRDTRHPYDVREVVARMVDGSRFDEFKERYGAIAEGKASGTCCGDAGRVQLAVGIGYDTAELATVPDEANLGLGCGAPIAHLDLKPGETGRFFDDYCNWNRIPEFEQVIRQSDVAEVAAQ